MGWMANLLKAASTAAENKKAEEENTEEKNSEIENSDTIVAKADNS